MVYEGLCGEISIFFESQTDRLTDRLNRLLNPASRMRAQGKNYKKAKDLVMACHTPPLDKVKK